MRSLPLMALASRSSCSFLPLRVRAAALRHSLIPKGMRIRFAFYGSDLVRLMWSFFLVTNLPSLLRLIVGLERCPNISHCHVCLWARQYIWHNVLLPRGRELHHE